MSGSPPDAPTGPGSPLTRRVALRRALFAGAGATVVPSTLSGVLAPGGALAATANARTIMLVRHAEKPDGSGAPYGITPAGEHDTESLTVRGWTRAGALVELFDSGHPQHRGLARPAGLVASDPGGAGSKRPMQTVGPLSERLGLKIGLVPVPAKKSGTQPIADALLAQPGPVLGAFQHKLIPAIAQRLGQVSPAVPSQWPEDRFDLVWVFVRRRGGTWQFSQVPQLLLFGDRSSVVTGAQDAA